VTRFMTPMGATIPSIGSPAAAARPGSRTAAVESNGHIGGRSRLKPTT